MKCKLTTPNDVQAFILGTVWDQRKTLADLEPFIESNRKTLKLASSIDAETAEGSPEAYKKINRVFSRLIDYLGSDNDVEFCCLEDVQFYCDPNLTLKHNFYCANQEDGSSESDETEKFGDPDYESLEDY